MYKIYEETQDDAQVWVCEYDKHKIIGRTPEEALHNCQSVLYFSKLSQEEIDTIFKSLMQEFQQT